ncbi:MAG TPA: ABC transporter permease, partial [Aggregatilineales bacterium]|nr:ABC transporter permease [Aggregatilineales bacterium]
PDFAERMARGEANVLLLVDGSSSFTSQSAYNTANAISQQYAVSLILTRGGSPVSTHLQILYNPDLKDVWFITPAFIAMLLQVLAERLTAFAIVREREMGTIEALLVTPIRPVELMIAKMIPNMVLAFSSAFSMLIVGALIFGVPFRGSVLLFFGLALINVGCGLSLGLMLSSAVQTQNQAQQLDSMVSMSGMFLAGVFFPTYALPWILRALSFLFPMTYFIPILRGIALKGLGFADLWPQALALVIFLVVTLFITTRLFRPSLD